MVESCVYIAVDVIPGVPPRHVRSGQQGSEEASTSIHAASPPLGVGFCDDPLHPAVSWFSPASH